jgi:hypothetical protein
MLFKNPAETEMLFAKLILLKVSKIEVEFAGSGDSGQIDSVAAYDAHSVQIDLTVHQVPWDEPKSTLDASGNWVHTKENHDMPVNEIITQMCNDALEESDLDWYNNDGGQGTFTIDLSTNPPEAKLHVGINFTHTEDHEFEMEGLYKKPRKARIKKEKPSAPASPRANKRKNLGRKTRRLR